MQFTEREIATILHGLRMIQCEGRIEGCAAGDCQHFDGLEPMTNDDIDRLCMELNDGGNLVPTPIKPTLSSDEWKDVRRAVLTKKKSATCAGNDPDSREWRNHLAEIVLAIKDADYSSLLECDWQEIYYALVDSDANQNIVEKIGVDGQNMIGVSL